MGKACVVTGGCGFIGSHLVGRLLELGYEVRVIDNLFSGKKENLKKHEGNSNLKIFVKDICDKDIAEILRGASVVFHVAAVPKVQYSINFPEITNNANINGTLNVLEACRKAGVKRVVYSASSSAYGNQDKLPLVETMKPNPMSPYAAQKLTGEYYCRVYYLAYGLETICLRYFNVYGPGQDPSGGYAALISKTIGLALKGESPTIYGDGKQTRDFTFVKDVVEANILAATTSNTKAFGESFNIGNSNNVSVNFVVEKIMENLGRKDIKINYAPPVIEPKDTLADITKAKEILGWSPKYVFEQGIKESVDWFKK